MRETLTFLECIDYKWNGENIKIFENYFFWWFLMLWVNILFFKKGVLVLPNAKMTGRERGELQRDLNSCPVDHKHDGLTSCSSLHVDCRRYWTNWKICHECTFVDNFSFPVWFVVGERSIKLFSILKYMTALEFVSPSYITQYF